MQSHYTITGAVHYYRTLPTQVELRKADSVEPARGDRLAMLGSMMEAHDSAMLTIAEAAAIKGPFNFSRWKDPPHVALANLRDEPAAALQFTRTYGVLARDYHGEPRTVPVSALLEFRDQLRCAWDGDEQASLDILRNKQAILSMRPTGLEVVAEDLWTLICVLFARDMWDGRTKKCQNLECPATYFLAVRKGQKFCSQKCAVLINVRRFRKREVQRTAKKKRSPESKKSGRKAVKPTKARKAS